MNEINKTMYIPLYSKAMMSSRQIILNDPKAVEIWAQESFPLKRRSKSKWLAYFLSMRARVFDDWTAMHLSTKPEALVLHLGCGLDSRVLRVGGDSKHWYDVDNSAVIEERKKYYQESDTYHMIATDITDTKWIDGIEENDSLVVVMEGVGMYLSNFELDKVFTALDKKFPHIYLLIDVYTPFGAKMSKYRNPIGDVGATRVYGVERPELLMASNNLHYLAEHSMTPQNLIDELHGFDRMYFSMMYSGNMAKKVYRLYEFKK